MSNEVTTYKGGKLHDGQKRIVKSIINSNNKYSAINASRQSGKTFLMKQLILYFAINNPKTTTLVISPYNAQNLRIYKELLSGIKNTNIVKQDNKSDKIIELINGSVIIFKSSENYDAIRGQSVDYLHMDEMAYFKKDAWDLAIRPTIAAKKHARVFAFSTPRGKNEFYDLCTRGWSDRPEDKQYKYYWMSYLENPLYDIDFVNDCKKYYPKAKFEQEFEGKFFQASSVFDYTHCAVLDQFEEPQKNVKYYAGLDLARKKDKSVLTIMDEDGIVVFIYEANGGKWKTIVDEVVRLLKLYNNASCLVEINSIGDVVFEMLTNEYSNLDSIYTNNKNKQKYIEELIYAFSNSEIAIPTNKLSPQLHLELDVFEMSFSEKTRQTVYRAREGFHDDFIISLSLVNKQKNENKLNNNYPSFYIG